MAAKFQDTKSYPLPIQCFVLEMRSQPIRDFMKIKWVGEELLPNGALHYQYQHGMGMASWGETIDIWLTAQGERNTQVDIKSECYLPTQIMDWGKNRENVVNIFMYLDHCVNTFLTNNGPNFAIPQVELPQQQTPAQPHPVQPTQQMQQPVQQPQQAQYQPPVCPNCRTPITPGAKFCSNCGTRLV